MPVKHKYTFLCLLVVCVTILCFIWIVQDRLCELSIKRETANYGRSLLTNPGSSHSAGEKSPAF
ncbi:Hok/Gef family protein [Atlantibacter hermannii]|uniref:Hok/Gef family protein n=1 Tax=Atlantibacter hermannii TaxID=565 RepID=UPI00358DB298